ncbi:MAG: hypothetical protein RIF39_18060 [Cyclobacteriaceae bacterium]
MKRNGLLSRRSILKGSIIGLAGVALPLVGRSEYNPIDNAAVSGKPHPNYPAISDDIVAEVVGKSHFDLEKVKSLVDQRPELASATWDWGFGDFESAIGAASHVGRRDIVEYLLSRGAKPNLFTYTVLGAHDVVKGMIEFTPGIQRTLGPHGISLLQHAKAGLRMESEMSAGHVANAKKLIAYLEALGDADGKQYEDLDESEKPKYLGDYKYGEAEDEGFSIKLNMRKNISLGKIGAFGGALYKIGENKFFYNGAPSTVVSFQWNGDKVMSLTVTAPDAVVVADKII